MKEIKAIIQPFMLEKVCDALRLIEDLPGITVSEVTGWGKSKGVGARETVRTAGCTFARKVKIEIVVPSDMAEEVVEVIEASAHTGRVGDGKIFVHSLDAVVKIRTGECGREGI